MSAVVVFSSGELWFANSLGWYSFVERARARLPDAEGLDDYGVFFDMMSDEDRLPVARALLGAARELHQEAIADGEEGNADHSHRLAELLEVELATTERPVAVHFGIERWTAEPATWQRISARARDELEQRGLGQLADRLRPEGMRVDPGYDEQFVQALLDTVEELATQPPIDSRLHILADHLAALLGTIQPTRRHIYFPDGTDWITTITGWERLVRRAATVSTERPVGGLVSRRGIAFALMDEPTVRCAIHALHVAATALLTDPETAESDRTDLRRLLDEVRPG
ncbi:hypothetical protein [Nocardia alni]|uniref:hypothetical protein n=1 Tax=Nocardia alni TaxID=2815723 RepID=UPI001C212D3C|nr:hypothetical protein [Nocardia alni]